MKNMDITNEEFTKVYVAIILSIAIGWTERADELSLYDDRWISQLVTRFNTFVTQQPSSSWPFKDP